MIDWPTASVILGIVVVISETFIRIKTSSGKKSNDNNTSMPNHESENRIILERRLNTLELKMDNVQKEISNIINLMSELEKDNVEQVRAISTKIDTLQQILLEATLKNNNK